jgi:hypothetical protein
MGRLLVQSGEEIFRLFTRDLEIKGIRAKVNLIGPGKLAIWADSNLFKRTRVKPEGKNAFAD